MNRLKISTLTLALLGSLALAACDNNAADADLGDGTADTAAAETPMTDAGTPVVDENATLGADGMDDTSTMGDVPEPLENNELGNEDPAFDLGNEPVTDDLEDDTLDDGTQPVDGSQPNQ